MKYVVCDKKTFLTPSQASSTFWSVTYKTACEPLSLTTAVFFSLCQISAGTERTAETVLFQDTQTHSYFYSIRWLLQLKKEMFITDQCDMSVVKCHQLTMTVKMRTTPCTALISGSWCNLTEVTGSKFDIFSSMSTNKNVHYMNVELENVFCIICCLDCTMISVWCLREKQKINSFFYCVSRWRYDPRCSLDIRLSNV